MKLTKKMYREELNRLDAEYQANGNPKYKNYQFHQVKRLYGDYLYNQDREKFNHYFHEWQVEKMKELSCNTPAQ